MSSTTQSFTVDAEAFVFAFYGGDEFVIVLSESSPADALSLRKGIRPSA
jgi:hypothetical protein